MTIVNIDATILDATAEVAQHQVVSFWTGSQQNFYAFYIDGNADLVYSKSTDQGATWGAPVVIATTEDYRSVAVWFDRWTPGDTTGNTIHIIALQTTNNKAVYFSLGVDDDLAEANNAVDIRSVTAIGNAADGGGYPCISKAKSGNLFVTWNASSPAGLEIDKSADAGATWANISSPAGGADPGALFADKDDRALLDPLSTDDDMLMVINDENNDDLYSMVYDEVADEWESRVFIGNCIHGASSTQTFAINCNRTSNDIYLVFLAKTFGLTYFGLYDESARTWGNFSKIMPSEQESQRYNARYNKNGAALCYYEPTNTLIYWFTTGAGTNNREVCYRISHDDGVTWSGVIDAGNFAGNDDIRSVTCSAILINAEEAMLPFWMNDDTNSFKSSDNALFIEAYTGVVKDDAGVAVSGAQVRLFRSGVNNNIGEASKETYLGSAITDGSGNYSFGIPKNQMDGHNNYYYVVATNGVEEGCNLGENFKWHGIDLSGTRGLYTKTGTLVAHDDTNNELDWDAGGDTSAHAFNAEFVDVIGPSPLLLEDHWRIRFKIRIANVIQGASAIRSGFYVGMSDGDDTPDTTGHFIGICFTTDNVNVDVISAITGTSTINAGTRTNFTRNLTAETLFVEIVRTSKTTFDVRLYSDEFITLLEEKTAIATSIVNEPKYLIFGVEGGATEHTLDGAVEWWQLWDATENEVTENIADAIDASFITRMDV